MNLADKFHETGKCQTCVTEAISERDIANNFASFASHWMVTLNQAPTILEELQMGSQRKSLHIPKILFKQSKTTFWAWRCSFFHFSGGAFCCAFVSDLLRSVFAIFCLINRWWKSIGFAEKVNYRTNEPIFVSLMMPHLPKQK